MREEVTTGETDKAFMRLSEVCRALGLTRYQVECLVDSGALTRARLPGMKQSYFKTDQIIKKKGDIVDEG